VRGIVSPTTPSDSINKIMKRCGSLLNLAHWGFPKDLRKWFIKNYLDQLDICMIWYAHTNNIYLDEEYLFKKATKKGYLNLLKWMDKKVFEYGSYILGTAVRAGHLEIAKWLHETGSFSSYSYDELCLYAAEKGHFEILKWCREIGCSWDEDVCYDAAVSGEYDIVKWARENGCPWNSYVATGAAHNGHLNILIYAIENGCPCNKEQLLRKRTHELNPEILDWINKHME
jgi:hypothetical protein